MYSLLRNSLLVLMFCTCSGCFMPPTPRHVSVSGWPISRIRNAILNENDVEVIDDTFAGLELQMAIHAKANRVDIDKYWLEQLNTLKAIHAKANGEWRGLKIRPKMSEILRMEELSPRQTVIALVYGQLSLNIKLYKRLRQEYVHYYNSIKPTDERLLRHWTRLSN